MANAYRFNQDPALTHAINGNVQLQYTSDLQCPNDDQLDEDLR